MMHVPALAGGKFTLAIPAMSAGRRVHPDGLSKPLDDALSKV
jgi:hypothetical protein